MTLIAPNLEGFDYADIRGALKAVAEAAAPKASVHKEFKLEVDPVTMLGKVSVGMNGKADHGQFVHSVMIGLQSDAENVADNGTYSTVGGGSTDGNLSFAVWFFYDYKSWRVKFGTSTAIGDDSPEKNATAFAESEWRAWKGYLRMNPTLGLQTGRVRYVFPPKLENQDDHGFSTGKRILVLQTSVVVRVKESFA